MRLQVPMLHGVDLADRLDEHPDFCNLNQSYDNIESSTRKDDADRSLGIGT